MRINHFFSGLIILTIVGCTKQPQSQPSTLNLGNDIRCKSYSGLPDNWLKDNYAGMVPIPAGEIILGNNKGYIEEKPFYTEKLSVKKMWADQTEVTVAQFKSFVDATAYVTDAEKQGGSAVFTQPENDSFEMMSWWKFKQDVSWKNIDGKFPNLNEPVRYVTYNDAIAYASWLGRDLPTELEYEYLAKGYSQSEDIGPITHGEINANYWQGNFPVDNTKEDGYVGVAPVGCFKSNPFQIYDIIGNVWEWTQTPYTGPHSDLHMGDPSSVNNKQPHAANMTIKGGSFLCSANYCARYRATSRHPQELNLATSHVGFRTIIRQ